LSVFPFFLVASPLLINNLHPHVPHSSWRTTTTTFFGPLKSPVGSERIQWLTSLNFGDGCTPLCPLAVELKRFFLITQPVFRKSENVRFLFNHPLVLSLPSPRLVFSRPRLCPTPPPLTPHVVAISMRIFASEIFLFVFSSHSSALVFFPPDLSTSLGFYKRLMWNRFPLNPGDFLDHFFARIQSCTFSYLGLFPPLFTLR